MRGFAELAAASNFSFLRGASHPEELVVTAAALGLSGLALADRNSLAGVVRAHLAGREVGLRTAVGCRLVFEDGTPDILAWPTDRAAYGRLCRLLTLPEPPTAVFAANDPLAIRTMQAAARLGIPVPERLSVVGFDDRPAAALLSPPLTTVRQPMADVGRAAAIALMDELEAAGRGEGDRPAARLLLPPELVVRGTTAAVPPLG